MVRISSRHGSTSSSGTPVRTDCNTSPQRNQQRNVAIESAHRQPPVVLINDKDWRQTRVYLARIYEKDFSHLLTACLLPSIILTKHATPDATTTSQRVICSCQKQRHMYKEVLLQTNMRCQFHPQCSDLRLTV